MTHKTKIQRHSNLNTFSKILFILFVQFFCVQNSFSQNISIKPVLLVAKVSNSAITNVDLFERYNLILKISKLKPSNKQEKEALLNQILQKMIDEELQIKEAERLSINLDQKRLDQLLLEISTDWNQNKKKLKFFFTENYISYQSFERQLKAEILWSDVIKSKIIDKVKISQSEIDEMLEVKKISHNVNKFFLSEILISLDNKKLDDFSSEKEVAFKLFNELKQNKYYFNNFVKQFSKSPTAEFNGDIGWVGDVDVDKKVYQIIDSLKIGDISEPILMKDGYHIFKVKDKKVFSTLTEEDLEKIKDIIFNKKITLLAKEYMNNLRKNSYIEIDKKILSQF